MKKLLVVLLSAIMVLSLAAVSMAAPEISGEINYKINYNADGDMDCLDGKFNIKSKVNDQISVTISPKFDTSKGAGSEGFLNFFINEAYSTINPGFGTFTVGLFEWKLYNTALIDNADTTFGRMKAPVTIKYDAPKGLLPDGFNAGFVYFADDANSSYSGGKWTHYYDNKELFARGAYVLTAGYANKLFGVDANWVNIQMAGGQDNQLNNDVRAQNMGYTINAFVKPVDFAKAYVHYGKNEVDQFERILGAEVSIPDTTFVLTAEYNFADERNGAGITGDADYEQHNYAWNVAYTAKNGIKYQYRRKDTGGYTKMGNQELRAQIKFK